MEKLPPAFKQGLQATLAAAAQAANAPSFANAFFHDSDNMEQLVAAHVQGYQAIKAVRPNLPTGIGLSPEDDQAEGSAGVGDAKRAAVYGPWFAVTRERERVRAVRPPATPC